MKTLLGYLRRELWHPLGAMIRWFFTPSPIDEALEQSMIAHFDDDDIFFFEEDNFL